MLQYISEGNAGELEDLRAFFKFYQYQTRMLSTRFGLTTREVANYINPIKEAAEELQKKHYEPV